MKFIISTSSLLKRLSAVSGVIPSSPVVPILENFLFEIKDGRLNITASDLQTSVITAMDVEADADGGIAIPARMLVDTLRNLPEQPVTFRVDFDTYTLEIISDTGRYKLACENATDFPRSPQISKPQQLDLTTDTLLTAINYTLFATSTDEMKPAMNGVFFNFTEESANFVATDTHRLVRYRYQGLQAENPSSIIINRKALNLLKSTLPSENTVVNLSFNDSNAVFSFGDFRLICRLIDERFPDYENVIPVHNDNNLTVERESLIACLKRLVIYANKSTSQVRFKVVGNEIQLTAEDLDFSNEATERIFCDHDGEDIEIGFSAKFLLEMLSNMHGEKVIFKLSDPGKSGLIVPEDEEEDLLMLVMPIMLHTIA